MARLILTLLALCTVDLVQGWWDTGHILTAEVAYLMMSPEDRGMYDKVVAYNRRTFPKSGSFSQGATWPDDLKSMGLYVMGAWHYEDVYWVRDQNDSALLANVPSSDGQNVSWAINELKTSMASTRASPWTVSFSLFNILHFVGDCHQPLHATSLVAKNHPEGDRGGNSYHVKVDGRSTGLHKVWDSIGYGYPLLDNFQRPFNDFAKGLFRETAEKLIKKYALNDKTMERESHNYNVESWVQESSAIAQKEAYSIPEGSNATQAYLDKVKEICERRIVLGGMRLLNLLNYRRHKPQAAVIAQMDTDPCPTSPAPTTTPQRPNPRNSATSNPTPNPTPNPVPQPPPPHAWPRPWVYPGPARPSPSPTPKDGEGRTTVVVNDHPAPPCQENHTVEVVVIVALISIVGMVVVGFLAYRMGQTQGRKMAYEPIHGKRESLEEGAREMGTFEARASGRAESTAEATL